MLPSPDLRPAVTPTGAPDPIRIALVGCGRSKANDPRPARDLYTGGLFRSQLAHAEATADEVRIVSAKYGLLPADWMVAPYDHRLSSLSRDQRAAWAHVVAATLLVEFRGIPFQVELYLGAEYAEPLLVALAAAGIPATWPVKGMPQGARLGFYRRERESREAAR